MAKVLVTGATGLVGSALTRRLVDAGEEVRIYRREQSRLDALGDICRSVEHAVGDLTDAIALREAMAGIEQVYHVAAYVSFGGRSDRDALMRINVDGTRAVIDSAMAAGVHRLVHTSSMAAFGRPERPDGILDEGAEWHRSRADSVYARSKYLSELHIHRGIAEGLDAVIVNPALVFGAGRTGSSTRRLIDSIRSRRLPAIPIGTTNVVDVLDVVEGMRRAMDRGRTGERYFLGNENLSWRSIIHSLCSAFGTRPPKWTLPRRAALALASAAEGAAWLFRTRPLITRENARSASGRYKYSNRKAKEELGCTFRPFDATVERLASELDGEVADYQVRSR